MTQIVVGPQPYLGVFNIDDPLANAGNYAAQTGSSPAVMHVHADWTLPDDYGVRQLLTFDEPVGTVDNIEGAITRLAGSLAEQGTMLAVSWDPMSIDYLDDNSFNGTNPPAIALEEILSGDFDTYIAEVAGQVRDMDRPILMSLFGESDAAALFGYGPDGNQYRLTVDDQTGQYGDPALLDGPERVRDVFRHIIDIFEAEGATNVTWYQYMGTHFGVQPDAAPLDTIYPGDAYIDWIGTSIYVEDASGLGAALDTGYAAWGAVTDNPFFVAEMGINDTTPGQMAQLLSGLSGYERVIAATFADFESATQQYDLPRLGDGSADWSTLGAPPGFTNDIAVAGATGPAELAAWTLATGRILDPTEFRGSAGNDVLLGREQNDRLIGLEGDDTYVVDSTDDTVIEAAQGGYDTVLITVSYVMSDHVEALHVVGAGEVAIEGNAQDNMIVGNDAVNLVNAGGGADIVATLGGADRIDAGAGNDAVLAGAGNDTVLGGAGDDILEGEAGDDDMHGGAGTDVFDGGAGNDTLHMGEGADYALGGDGADTFIFGLTGGIAVIADFDAAADTLDVATHDIGTVSELARVASDVEGGVFITTGGHSLYVEGITLADLTADVLIFS